MLRRIWIISGLMLAAGPAAAQFSSPMPQMGSYALLSAIPQRCSSAPAPDTLMGGAGSQSCYVPQDAVTWGRAFSSSNPIINAIPVNVGGQPIVCNVTSRSATAAAGKCWQTNQQANALLSLTTQ